MQQQNMEYIWKRNFLKSDLSNFWKEKKRDEFKFSWLALLFKHILKIKF